MDKIELKVIIFPAQDDREDVLAGEIISHLQSKDRNILIVPANQDSGAFLIWLDEQIETNENLADREDHKMEPNLSYRGQQYALEAAKEKYLSLNKQDTK